jgi:hypothetical protein
VLGLVLSLIAGAKYLEGELESKPS